VDRPFASLPPDLLGWLALLLLVAGFGLFAWWLLASPLPGGAAPAAPPMAEVPRVRRLMAGVVLLSGVLLRVGAPWDELWHRLYGVPFGQDLLWPPHLLMYASIALSFLLVFYGLSVALGGPGGLRARFRREPLLGALGLLSAYGFAFIPVDVLWHALIGPDIVAESPPHVVGALSGAAVSLTGVALAASTLPRTGWRSLLDRPRPAELVALGILAVLTLNWLQLFTTGWEWVDPVVLVRPAWTYPVAVLLIGAAVSHLALHATRRVGAATAVALVVLVAHAPAVAAYRLLLPPGPAVGAHLMLVAAALLLDAWYGLRRDRAETPATRRVGALLYGAALLAVAAAYVRTVMAAPVLDATAVLVSAVVGLPAAVVVGLLAARLGASLGDVGRATPGAVATSIAPGVAVGAAPARQPVAAAGPRAERTV
jgi:hypothetical protein